MTKSYQFQTEQFRFAEEEFQLLRSQFPYKRVAFTEIAKISITRSVRVKRPLIVLAFGLALIFTSCYFLLFSSGFIDEISNSLAAPGESFRYFKTLGYLLIMYGFLIALGGVAVYQAVFPTWVMRTDFTNGTFNVFTLDKLLDTNEVSKFVQYLKKNFRNEQLEIDGRIA